MRGLKRVQSKSLQALVYDQLREAMLNGFFAPGQLLSLRALAERLGTSEMPVRAALNRLVSENACEVTGVQRASVRVPVLSATNFDDICQTRKLLEGEATSRSALCSTAKLVAELQALNQRVTAAADAGKRDQMIIANRAFHFAIYKASGSRTLMQAIEPLWLQSGPYFHVLMDRYANPSQGARRDRPAVSAHQDIIAAVNARDVDAARQALHRDIDRSAAWFRSWYEQLQDDSGEAPNQRSVTTV